MRLVRQLGIVLLIAELLSGCSFVSMLNGPSFTSKPVTIDNETFNPANYYQSYYRAGTALAVWDGKLYFRPPRLHSIYESTQYAEHLSVFEKGTAVAVKKLSNIILIHNGFVYRPSSVVVDEPKLLAYEISTGQSRIIGQYKAHKGLYMFPTEDTLYLQADETGASFYPIKGFDMGEPEQIAPCTLGEYRFYIEDAEVVYYDAQNNRVSMEEQMGYAEFRTLLPCKKGILVHNYGGDDQLYLIEEDGQLVSLVQLQCGYSESSVNVHGSYVYLSVKRFAGLEKFPGEQDVTEETYRINLSDRSVEKISDAYYQELYIFDDTGIYAVTEEGRVFMLDFCGNVVDVLVR